MQIPKIICGMILVGLSSVLFWTGDVRAEEPCFAGVCLGASLNEFPEVQWKDQSFVETVHQLSAQNSGIKPPMPWPVWLTRILPDLSDEMYRRLGARSVIPGEILLDQTTQAPLGQIATFCDVLRVSGTFFSSSGEETNLRFSVLPDRNGRPGLRVTRIERVFHGIRGESPWARAMVRTFAERYRVALGINLGSEALPGESAAVGALSLDDSDGIPVLSLAMFYRREDILAEYEVDLDEYGQYLASGAQCAVALE